MDIDTIKAYAEQHFKEIEHGEPETFETLKHHDQQRIALQQLWLQADQTEATGCIAGVLIEMAEQRKQKEGDHSTDDGVDIFATTIEHGLELHMNYLDTFKGREELENLSPELKDILGHYGAAARLWVNDFHLEEDEDEGEETHG